MKRKFIIIMACTLLMLTAAFPVCAAEETVGLQVNGDTVPLSDIYMWDDSYSMVSLDTFTKFTGVAVNWSGDNDFTISKNGVDLRLTLGQVEALLGDEPLILPVAPAKKADDGVFIPLRAAGSAFGFTVEWNEEQQQAVLTGDERRDGMTAAELAAKSSVASMDYNTYSMAGSFNITMNALADGKPVEEFSQQTINTQMSGQMQNEPFQVYMKQTTSVPLSDAPITVETYMDQAKMYFRNLGEEAWTVMDMPFSPEFWQEQMDIQSDPLKTAAFMDEMGMLLHFGNDATVNGQDYYVVNATIDMDKFQQGYQDLINQILPQQGMESAAVEEILKNLTMDYRCSIFINKETLLSDIVQCDIHMNMNMDMADLAAEMPDGEDIDEDMPETVSFDMQMKGSINIIDPGAAFNAPDLSVTQEMSDIFSAIPEGAADEGNDEKVENAEATESTGTESAADADLDDAQDLDATQE